MGRNQIGEGQDARRREKHPTVSCQATPEIKKALQEEADRARMSLSNYIRRVFVDHLREKTGRDYS